MLCIRDRRLLDRVGALLPESQIVLAAATVIGVALNQHLELAIADKELGVRSDQILVLGLDFVLVIVEIDAALGEYAFRIGKNGRQIASVNTCLLYTSRCV